MKLSHISILLLSFSILHAQSYWEVTEDSGFLYVDSDVSKLLSDNEGNIYVYGSQPLDVYPTLYFFEKRDSNGNVLWKINLNEAQAYIHTNPDGSTYMLHTEDVSTPSLDLYNYYLKKYNTSGILVWQKTLFIPDVDASYVSISNIRVAQNNDLYIIMQGCHLDYPWPDEFDYCITKLGKYSSVTGNLVTLTSLPSSAILSVVDSKSNLYLLLNSVDGNMLKKYDKFLTLIWEQNVGVDYVPDMFRIFKDKAIYFVDEVSLGISWDSIVVKKYSTSTGENLYTQKIPTPTFLGLYGSDITLYDFEFDTKGNSIIRYNHNFSGIDIHYLLKLKYSDGSVLFHNDIESTTDYTAPNLNAVSVNSNGDIFLTGNKTEMGEYIPTCRKYNKFGTEIWEHSVTNSTETNRNAFINPIHTINNQIIMGGAIEYVGFNYARYIVAFDANLTERTASTNNAEHTVPEIYFSPNPANDFIQLQSYSLKDIRYIITYNSSGEIVPVSFSENFTADVSKIPTGVYLSEIHTKNGTIVESWMKH